MGCCSCLCGCVKGGIDCVAKTLLMSLNGFFAVQGVTITVLATIALVLLNTLGGLGSLQGLLISVICVGAIILITSFLGCCGACFKNKFMLIIYIVLLVLLIIGQIVMVSMAGGLKKDALEDWKDNLDAYNPDIPDTMNVTDAYQKKNKCCGVTNITDWQTNPHMNLTASVPDSCCVDVSPDCGQGYFENPEANVDKIYTTGCYDEIGLWGEIVWGIIISIIIIQAVLVVLAGCLTCKVGGGDKN